MLVDEVDDRVGEREGANSQRIEMDASRLEIRQRLVHRRRGRAEIDHADLARLLGAPYLRRRGTIDLRRLELAQKALHVVDIDRRPPRCIWRSDPSRCRA